MCVLLINECVLVCEVLCGAVYCCLLVLVCLKVGLWVFGCGILFDVVWLMFARVCYVLCFVLCVMRVFCLCSMCDVIWLVLCCCFLIMF